MTWCGVWRVEGVSPYVDIRLGGIRWNYGSMIGKKIDKNQLKVKQSRQTRVYLGCIQPKSGTMRFGPMAGLVGCVLYLISEYTCFWPQTDRYTFFWTLTYLILQRGIFATYCCAGCCMASLALHCCTSIIS